MKSACGGGAYLLSLSLQVQNGPPLRMVQRGRTIEGAQEESAEQQTRGGLQAETPAQLAAKAHKSDGQLSRRFMTAPPFISHARLNDWRRLPGGMGRAKRRVYLESQPTASISFVYTKLVRPSVPYIFFQWKFEQKKRNQKN